MTFVSTGLLPLDRLLDNNGFKTGRLIEIFGQENVGKTYLVLNFAQHMLRSGKVVLYADTDRSFSDNFVRNFKLELKGLYLFYPKSICEFFDFVLRKFKVFDVFILDSFPSLYNCSLENNVSTNRYAEINKVSNYLKHVCARLYSQNKIFILINQLRFIRKGLLLNLTQGKTVINFYASLRIQMWIERYLHDDSGNIIGHETIFKICKNRDGTPNLVCSIDFLYNKGFVWN